MSLLRDYLLAATCLPSIKGKTNIHQNPLMELAMMGTDHASSSSSSTRHEIEEILTDHVNSSRHEDIAIQVENDVTASFKKIDGDNESITLIPRVPEIFRHGANGAYDPQVISIGPYHWGKPHLEAMERHKRHYQVEFLKRSPEHGLEDYMKEIEALEPRLRSSYHKDIQMTSENFVEMMLLDACFLVELSLQMMEGVPDSAEKSRGQSWSSDLMMYDIVYLLENQLPFFLLQRIYDISTTTTKENLERPSSYIQVAIEFCSSMGREGHENLSTPIKLQHQLPKTIHHFIHLYHSLHTSEYFIKNIMFEIPCDESSIMRMVWKDLLATLKNPIRTFTIPSATGLHDLGIKFKIVRSPFPLHIKFHRGVMEITPLYFDKFIAGELLNNVAFERLYFEDEPCFFEFYKFMNQLVNTSKDVALLRKYDIIHHEFGSDEELALFFSQLTKGVLTRKVHLSSRMCKEVNKYCNIKRHRWRASLIRDYCSSPWSTLGLVVGFMLLALTFVQSYMSLHAYFRPPQS